MHSSIERRLRELESVVSTWKRIVLRPATRDDYKRWLIGYLRSGGEPTHYYDYKFPEREFYVAVMDFRIQPLYGAFSFSIIVPKGIRFLGGELGHINLFLMDGFRNIGGWVPVYEDMIPIGIDEIDEKIERLIERERSAEMASLRRMAMELERLLSRWKGMVDEKDDL